MFLVPEAIDNELRCFSFYFGKGFYFNALFWKERKIAELILNSIYRKKYGGHLLNTCADKNSKMRRC